MNQTVRLVAVEEKPRGFFPFRRKQAPPPDMVLIGQLKMRVADACIEQMRTVFPDLADQEDVHELVGDVLTDARRRLRAYEGEQE
jgi:hypothetical protein